MVSVGKNVTCTVLQPRDTREAERERGSQWAKMDRFMKSDQKMNLCGRKVVRTRCLLDRRSFRMRGDAPSRLMLHTWLGIAESEVSGQERKHYHQWTRCSPQGYNQNVCYNRPPTRRKTECGQHGSVSLLRPRFPVNLCWLCNPRQSDLYNPPRAVSAAITMSQNILNKLPMRQGHLLSATLREIISWGLGGRAHIAAVRFSRRVVCYQQKIFIAVHETQFPRLRL